MRKTFYLLILSLQVVFYSNAQPSKVSYVNYTYFDYLLNAEFSTHLVFNNKTSSYHMDLIKGRKAVNTLSNGRILIGGVDDKYVFKNKTSNKLVSVESFESDNLFGVSEDLPKFDWKLQNSFKNINNYKCQLATTTFRGRDYEAWFTSKIAVSEGPWKFHGLPGLILQVADKTGSYQWTVTEIKIPSKYSIDKKATDFNPIALRDYHVLVAEHLKQLRARISAKLPEGTVTSVPKNRRRGIELYFEWEL